MKKEVKLFIMSSSRNRIHVSGNEKRKNKDFIPKGDMGPLDITKFCETDGLFWPLLHTEFC
jgi:hypothetical protein